MAYPSSEADFILDTDASAIGIGAALTQVQYGVEQPIAYASRGLSKSKRNYPSGHCTYNVCTLYVQLVQCTYNVRTLYVSARWDIEKKVE